MFKGRFTFMLRILERNPERVPMERLGEYIQEFAALLGHDNRPTFKGIKKASTGLMAFVPDNRVEHCRLRIIDAKNDENSKPGKHLRTLKDMLGVDKINQAQILDENSNVIFAIFGAQVDENSVVERLYQEATVDGSVTGLVSTGKAITLHVCDHFDRDLRLVVRNETLAREILKHFRSDSIRLRVRGVWQRNENGWSPEASKCTVLDFKTLENTSLSTVMTALAQLPGNGWSEVDDPQGEWEKIRGIH